MNATAVRWLRRLAKLGMVLAVLYWPVEMVLSFDVILEALVPPPGAVAPGPDWRSVMRMSFYPLQTAVTGVVLSAILFVACEIALHFHRGPHPDPDHDS